MTDKKVATPKQEDTDGKVINYNIKFVDDGMEISFPDGAVSLEAFIIGYDALILTFKQYLTLSLSMYELIKEQQKDKSKPLIIIPGKGDTN